MIPESPPKVALQLDAILQAESRRGGWRLLRQSFWGILGVGVLIASVQKAKINPQQFWERLPQLTDWLQRLWPPDFSELPEFVSATWETIAIAIVGTFTAMAIALPLAMAVARNVTPLPWLSVPLRGMLNLLRGIDTAIFALFFCFSSRLRTVCWSFGSSLSYHWFNGKTICRSVRNYSPRTD